MFQAGELDAMRAEYATSLLRTCTIPGARTVTNNGDGTWTETTTGDTTGVPCSFMATLGNERLVGGAIAQVGNYILRFAWNVSLEPKMTIVVDATATLPQMTFQLVAPLVQANPVGERWLATESPTAA